MNRSTAVCEVPLVKLLKRGLVRHEYLRDPFKKNWRMCHEGLRIPPKKETLTIRVVRIHEDGESHLSGLDLAARIQRRADLSGCRNVGQSYLEWLEERQSRIPVWCREYDALIGAGTIWADTGNSHMWMPGLVADEVPDRWVLRYFRLDCGFDHGIRFLSSS